MSNKKPTPAPPAQPPSKSVPLRESRQGSVQDKSSEFGERRSETTVFRTRPVPPDPDKK
jgi:hypothetical protein